MKWTELFARAEVSPELLMGEGDFELLASDSRTVEPGNAFVCMPSASQDSHRFIDQAVQNGACAALCHSREEAEKWSARIPTAFLAADRFEAELWKLCKVAFHDPTANMKVVGITGTNGKTTTAWIMHKTLENLGENSAYMGTLGIDSKKLKKPGNNTTPYPVELHGCLMEMTRVDVQCLVMEVSSHSLAQRRVDGFEFDLGIFTNLTQDHLDYHHTLKEYGDAKLRLFTDLPAQQRKPFLSFLNAEDPVVSDWIPRIHNKVTTYGFQAGDIRGEIRELGVGHLTMEIGGQEFRCRLGGRFNAWNVLAAAAGLLGLGYSLSDVSEAMAGVGAVPGRFESIPNDKGIGVIVDYAHTPDAIVSVLQSVQELPHRRIITVFGCGGDRDRSKRPKMANAASQFSDVTVITSDNPRTEDPNQIFADILPGVIPGRECLTIIDRKEAIAFAVHQAEPGDVVVIAGKGHEDYQIIGAEKVPLDDRELARKALGSKP